MVRDRLRISRFGDVNGEGDLPPVVFSRGASAPADVGPFIIRPVPTHAPAPDRNFRTAAVGAQANGRAQYAPSAAQPRAEIRQHTRSSSDYVPDGATVQFERPLEHPLQLLPGRLEVIEGLDSPEDIRFFRAMAGTPTVTLGRGDGPTHRHVKLGALTVSRTHARMQYEDGRWKICNLSKTNPLLVNGEALVDPDVFRWLNDGDRIEMGEVALRFREK